MKIIIDKFINKIDGSIIATIYIDTDWTVKMIHPISNELQVTILDLLPLYNTNPALRETAGWNVVSQLDGEDKPYSRWQRLVNHTNSDAGDTRLKAMSLT